LYQIRVKELGRRRRKREGGRKGLEKDCEAWFK
jgi:hypothetical protein